MGELKHRANIAAKYLKLSMNEINFFLNHVIISLNTSQTTQNMFLMIIEKNILIKLKIPYDNRKEYFDKSHQATQLLFTYYVSQLRGVWWGVKACADNADVGGQGWSKIRENMLT